MIKLLSPKSRLEQQIFDLYSYLNIKHPHEIDLDFIADSCHIDIVRTSVKRSRVISHPLKTDWMLIQIDSSLEEYQQREKIAHEITHCLLHVGNQLCLPSSFIKLQEAQARVGAAHFLMPFWMISPFCFESNLNPISQLASMFRVSVSFTKQRMELLKRRIMEKRLHEKWIESL